MRRHALFAILVVVLALLTIGVPAGATGGVPAGTPVIVRANPDNAIVGAARRAAATSGLGPVSAVGFSPDCSPVDARVVVCRNPTLHKQGARAVTLVGPDSCVIRTDPAVGGAPHGVNVLTKAMRKCITS